MLERTRQRNASACDPKRGEPPQAAQVAVRGRKPQESSMSVALCAQRCVSGVVRGEYASRRRRVPGVGVRSKRCQTVVV